MSNIDPFDKTEPATWLAREYGISVHDGEALIQIATLARTEPSRHVRADHLGADYTLAVVWLTHRGLVLTEDALGILYVSPSDKGREACRSAMRSARAAKRAA